MPEHALISNYFYAYYMFIVLSISFPLSTSLHIIDIITHLVLLLLLLLIVDDQARPRPFGQGNKKKPEQERSY